jgi:hypothetical protein
MALRLPVWTAFSRERGKIVAFVIGNKLDCAKKLYQQTKQVVGNIKKIYTESLLKI